MTVWLAFVLGGLVTYLERASFVAFIGDRELPVVIARALRYVGPAAFAAIVLPATVGDKGMARFVAPDARLIALVIAGVFMYRVRNMPVMLVVGMVSLWLLQWAGL
ncbi:MAG: AzlD domain-containing protein [Acidimicrobiales bacterium]|nr:AzlD domain-containing protein [Acidimicrobiales bacterium]